MIDLFGKWKKAVLAAAFFLSLPNALALMAEYPAKEVNSIVVTGLLFPQGHHYQLKKDNSQGFSSRIPYWVRRWMAELDPDGIIFLAQDELTLNTIFRHCFNSDILFRTIYDVCVSRAERLYQERIESTLQQASRLVALRNLNVADDEIFERMGAVSARKYSETKEERQDRIRRFLESLFVRSLLKGHSETKAYPDLEKYMEGKLRDLAKRSNIQKVRNFVNAYYKALDPHSAFLSPKEQEAWEQIVEGGHDGIGVRLSQNELGDIVMEPERGSAAARAGILAHDILLGAFIDSSENYQSFEDLELSQVRSKIRGKSGTPLRVKVRRSFQVGEEISIQEPEILIVRNTVSNDKGRIRAKVFQMGNKIVAVFSADSFYKTIAQDFRELYKTVVQKNGQLAGMILDLSDNEGGVLEEAISLAGLFVPSGPIAHVESLESTPVGTSMFAFTLLDSSSDVLYDGPLMVKINERSASASEIVAAFLQDSGRAQLMGQRTWGKGTIQDTFPAFSPATVHKIAQIKGLLEVEPQDVDETYGKIKMTSGNYFRVTKKSTQFEGVTPNLYFYPELGSLVASAERFLDNALPANLLNDVGNYFPTPSIFTLQRNSQINVDQKWLFSTPALQWIAEDRNTPEESMNLSLNLKKRRSEARKSIDSIVELNRKLSTQHLVKDSKRIDYRFEGGVILSQSVESFGDSQEYSLLQFLRNTNYEHRAYEAVQQRIYEVERIETEAMLQLMLSSRETAVVKSTTSSSGPNL
jgi:carboxyl-terminal processing protease